MRRLFLSAFALRARHVVQRLPTMPIDVYAESEQRGADRRAARSRCAAR